MENITELLKKGEGIEVEFKTSYFELNKNTIESICAFLNRKGGHLLLGVSDSGKVEGIPEDRVKDIKNNLVHCANNPNKLCPPILLSPEVIDYEGKKLVYVYIPESEIVHSTSGRFFDRTGDSDLDVTRHASHIREMHLRKSPGRTENWVFPALGIADCDPELFDRVRRLAVQRKEDHPWKTMSNEELIHSNKLYQTDPTTGESGLTLAGVLLFGTDLAILSAVSYYKTDALVRIENLDRYDDRDIVCTNLIDSYDRLMAFIEKHLPDKFYLEGTVSISIRDKIFREVVGNLLIHREYLHGFTVRLIIERDRLYAENWNIPGKMGAINPKKFSPKPKNPTIAKIFREIGYADELGSGVKNIFKYTPIYTPGKYPKLIEDDVFTTIIPLTLTKTRFLELANSGTSETEEFGIKFGEKFGINELTILEQIRQNPRISSRELARKVGISARAIEKNLAKLKNKGMLERIGSNKGGRWNIIT